jgi:hypothetical protein
MVNKFKAQSMKAVDVKTGASPKHQAKQQVPK